jgi:hypothetical protein
LQIREGCAVETATCCACAWVVLGKRVVYHCEFCEFCVVGVGCWLLKVTGRVVSVRSDAIVRLLMDFRRDLYLVKSCAKQANASVSRKDKWFCCVS